ncbi:hypothetical protein ACFY05_26250 [Microtetraspora fusca]|uniref:Uncharacterized protein n=1 Tax=Microtetraspora fusca TaxID=1997 RepID=A0ABW6VAM2_MICFU
MMARRRAQPGSDLSQPWCDLHDALSEDLRPYVPAADLDDLIPRIITRRISETGWRPPLRTDLEVITDARAARVAGILADGGPGQLWHDLRDGVLEELRPHVQTAVLDDLVARIIVERVASPVRRRGMPSRSRLVRLPLAPLRRATCRVGARRDPGIHGSGAQLATPYRGAVVQPAVPKSDAAPVR